MLVIKPLLEAIKEFKIFTKKSLRRDNFDHCWILEW